MPLVRNVWLSQNIIQEASTHIKPENSQELNIMCGNSMT